ncbi:MAG: hypothetical protein R2746_16805 [Acidimicrobiales bacterium]
MEVVDHALPQHQRLGGGVEARGGEAAGEAAVGGEVHGDEAHVGVVDAELAEHPALVGLGVGVVHLEPSHARVSVPQGPAVVAGPEVHDLGGAPPEGGDDDPIEERRPGVQVAAHARVAIHLEAVGNGGREPVVGRRVADGGAGRSLEPEPVRGDGTSGQRRLSRLHRRADPAWAALTTMAGPYP